MKRSKRTLLVSACAVALSGTMARAAMTLTPQGISAGFSLATFASGFPNSNTIGPIGIAFENSGSLITSDYSDGNIRIFANDTNNQTLANSSAGANFTNANGLANLGGNIYLNVPSSGSVVQLNQNGTLNRTVATGLSGNDGLIADPATGHLLCSDSSLNKVVDIDPANGTLTTFQTVTDPDGLALNPDGSILYVASNGAQVLGFNTSSKTQVFSSSISTIDGTALGGGILTGNIFGNTNDGRVIEVNLSTGVQTTIASGGSRGDFVTVDPSNGSLLLIQTDSILRLTGGQFRTQPLVSLTSTAPTSYGSQITNGSGPTSGVFTTGTSVLTVTGSRGSYLPAQVTGINGSAGVATDFVAVSGFSPATDNEVYGLDILVSGTQATPSQIATLVTDINSSSVYGFGSAIASSTDPEKGDFQNLSPKVPYNLFLTFTGLTTGSNYLGFDLSQDPTLGSTATIAAIAVVPEPASIAMLACVTAGMVLGRRRRQ